MFDIKTSDKFINSIKNQIADLQLLTTIRFYNNNNWFLCSILSQFINNDKMLLINNTSNILIPENIKYLNIIQNNNINNLLNNLPNTIEHLHVSYKLVNDINIDNLPISLITLTITLACFQYNAITSDKINCDTIKQMILKRIKLPYNCKLIVILPS